MTRNKKHRCRIAECPEVPYLGSLCKKHYEEDCRRRTIRQAAIDALATGTVGDRFLEHTGLREELEKIRSWWRRSCDAVNYQCQDPVLMDEAPYAVEWCIRLAEQIVLAEQAYRNGTDPNISLEFTKEWVWDRFRNLEAGHMSNGVKRLE